MSWERGGEGAPECSLGSGPFSKLILSSDWKTLGAGRVGARSGLPTGSEKQ